MRSSQPSTYVYVSCRAQAAQQAALTDGGALAHQADAQRSIRYGSNVAVGNEQAARGQHAAVSASMAQGHSEG